MNARPQRRTSALAAQSPLAPPAPLPVPAAKEEKDTARATKATASETSPTTKRSRAPRQTGVTSPDEGAKRIRIGPYVTEGIAERVRGAYQFGYLREGRGSFTDFLTEAIIEKVEKLEATFNGGDHFTGAGRGVTKSLSQMAVEERKRQQQ